jgi:hypothetical protein
MAKGRQNIKRDAWLVIILDGVQLDGDLTAVVALGVAALVPNSRIFRDDVRKNSKTKTVASSITHIAFAHISSRTSST